MRPALGHRYTLLSLQVLFWKKRGEEALQRSGIPYTVVRPGGLTNETRQGQVPGAIVMEGPGVFGLPPKRSPGSILRSQVRPTSCVKKESLGGTLWKAFAFQTSAACDRFCSNVKLYLYTPMCSQNPCLGFLEE